MRSAGSPKKCSAPSRSSTSSDRWMAPSEADATLPYFDRDFLGVLADMVEQRPQVLQVEQQQPLIVGDFERDVENTLLGVGKIHQPRQQQRPHFGNRRADRMPLLAEEIPEDRRESPASRTDRA